MLTRVRQDSQVSLLPLCHLPAISRTAPIPIPTVSHPASASPTADEEEGELNGDDGHQLGYVVVVRGHRHVFVGVGVLFVSGVDEVSDDMIRLRNFCVGSGGLQKSTHK